VGVENQDPDGIARQSEEPRPESVNSADHDSDLPPRFKLVFCTVAALTVLALILSILLALLGDGSEPVNAAAAACSTTYKMGFGAIVALIGRKGG